MLTTYHYFGNDYTEAYGLDHYHRHMEAWITLNGPVSQYLVPGAPIKDEIQITAPVAWVVKDGQGHEADQSSPLTGFIFVGVESRNRAGELINNIDFHAGWE